MVAIAVLLFIALGQGADELANALSKLAVLSVLANLVFVCLPRQWMSAPSAGTTAPPLYPAPYGPPLDARFQQQYEPLQADPFAPQNHHLR